MNIEQVPERYRKRLKIDANNCWVWTGADTLTDTDTDTNACAFTESDTYPCSDFREMD